MATSSSSSGESRSRPSNIKQSDSTPPTPLQPADQTDSSMAIGTSVAPASSSSFLQDLNFPFIASNGAASGTETSDDANNASLWNFATPGGGTSTFPFVGGANLDGNGVQQGFDGLSNNDTSSINALFPNAFGGNTTSQEPESSGSSMLSTSRPTGSQLPSHVAKNNPFLNKLRSMVDDPKTDDLIRWSEDGETFLVPNHIRFGDEVLPRFFKHNRFSSFVRQLNMYGFHKVPHLQQGALKSDPGQDTELWEFRNENFKRDRPELLLQMQRKKGVRLEDEAKEVGGTKGKSQEGSDNGGQITLDAINGALTRAQRGEGDTSLLQLASVWSAIQAIQSAQQGINDNLRHLHNTNNELWREAAEQRSRSKKQEETINKMLRFLAGIFGAQDVNNIGGAERHRADSSTPSSAASTSRSDLNRPYGKGRRRLLIGDGSTPGGQIEELEVPFDEDEAEDEPTPQARIVEARSSSNSPSNGNSPPMKLQDLPKTPNNKQASMGLPFVSSDTASTPGGGRRISQQAGAQLLNALASGEAQSWLANMFGQQQQQQQQQQQPSVGASSQSTRTRNDNLNSAANGSNSFKLDAQTLSALQSILAASGGGAGAGVGETGDPMGAQANGYFDGGLRSTEGQQSSAPAWSANALSPRPRPNGLADQSQVARLAPQQQQLQNTTQDAAAVQNVLNALVQGLRIENNGQLGQVNGGQADTNNLAGAANSSAGSSTAGPPPSASEVDMDSLLKEFFHDPSSDGLSSDSTPTVNGTANDFGGETPSFAFSPAPTTTVDGEAGDKRGQSSTASSSLNNSPPQTSSSRKRKPDDDDDDIDSLPSTRAPSNKVKTTRQTTTASKGTSG